MTVGLTFRQLLTAFFESLNERSNKFDREILTAEVGLNPITKQYLNMYPELTDTQARAYVIHLQAILNTIVLNNEAIAKLLPPLKE